MEKTKQWLTRYGISGICLDENLAPEVPTRMLAIYIRIRSQILGSGKMVPGWSCGPLYSDLRPGE
eukprot:1157282-Pelagomonas_calceolata.AAC.5